MNDEYSCPLVRADIDETICYDIQMVTGNYISERILDDYSDIFDAATVTKEGALLYCACCPFNQLSSPLVTGITA